MEQESSKREITCDFCQKLVAKIKYPEHATKCESKFLEKYHCRRTDSSCEESIEPFEPIQCEQCVRVFSQQEHLLEHIQPV